MQFVTVTLTAAEIGGRLTLYDANGRKVGSVAKEIARPADEECLAEILWTRKLQAMTVINLRFQQPSNHKSDWDRKLDNWRLCIRFRQNDKRREREGKRYFSAQSRPNWNAAIKCMQFAHRNRLKRKQKHLSNPWLLWAETCSKNHNRKERNRAAERREMQAERGSRVVNRTKAIAGGPRIQMCFDWDGVDAPTVIA